MRNQLHSESRKQFQLDRIIFFSDGVFAIAITLLVIDLKLPEIPNEGITEQKLIESLLHLIPRFIGFLISFFVIGQYWTVHHKLFGFVTGYTGRLIWLNLFFLLAVVLMPFSTSFYSEYSSQLLNSPVIVYVINISYLGIMSFILWKYISNPKRNLTNGLSKALSNYYSFRAITIPFIFITMALIYLFIAPVYAMWIPMFIPLIMWFIKKHFEKKLK